MLNLKYNNKTDPKITDNSGLILIGLFMKKLNVPSIIKKCFNIDANLRHKYKITDLFIMVLLSIITIKKKRDGFNLLRNDKTLNKIFEWEKFPSDITFTRLFNNLKNNISEDCILKVETIIRNKILALGGKKINRKNLELRSIHHEDRIYLYCFIIETRECLHSSYNKIDASDFVGQSLDKLQLKSYSDITIHADDYFFNDKVLAFIGKKKINFFVMAFSNDLINYIIEGKGVELVNWKKVRNSNEFESSIINDFNDNINDYCKLFILRKKKTYKGSVLNTHSKKNLGYYYEYQYFCYAVNHEGSPKYRTPWQVYNYCKNRPNIKDWIQLCYEYIETGQSISESILSFKMSIVSYNLLVGMLLLFNDDPRFQCSDVKTIINARAKLTNNGNRHLITFTNTVHHNEILWKSIDSLEFDYY